MKYLIMIAVLALAACDDQPKQRVEQILPPAKHVTAKPPMVRITMQNVMHLTHTPHDGTTPQQIAQAAIELMNK